MIKEKYFLLSRIPTLTQSGREFSHRNSHVIEEQIESNFMIDFVIHEYLCYTSVSENTKSCICFIAYFFMLNKLVIGSIICSSGIKCSANNLQAFY